MIRILILCLAAAWLSSCTTMRQYEVFHPCIDEDCAKCHGEKQYICPRCDGRRWLPPTFSFGFGSSIYNHHHHGSHPHSWTGYGLRFEECPTCYARGYIKCGKTTYFWKCRKCGKRFDKAIKPCPNCKGSGPTRPSQAQDSDP